MAMAKWERAVLGQVINRLDLNSASFSFNKEEDTKIKDAIRLWLDTWIKAPLSIIYNESEDYRAMRDYYKSTYKHGGFTNG